MGLPVSSWPSIAFLGFLDAFVSQDSVLPTPHLVGRATLWRHDRSTGYGGNRSMLNSLKEDREIWKASGSSRPEDGVARVLES